MYIKKNIYSKSSRRMNMSGFFSRSSSNRRYPDPNRGGSHYRKKGLFGILSGFGGSFGSRSSRGYKGYGGYPGQGYPDQGYPGQGYQQGGQTNLSGGQMSPRHGDGQMVCPKCGTAIPAGSKFCLSCGEKIEANASFCTDCGKPLSPGAKFCANCGKPVGK